MSDASSLPPGHLPRVQPETFRARALTASLTVKDIRASVAWYRDVIGFMVDRVHERDGEMRAVSLKAGTVRILLGQDNGAKGWDREKGQGFSLQFTTAQSADALAERIRARGGTLETEPTNTQWGTRVFGLRDPDGFLLVISSEA